MTLPNGASSEPNEEASSAEHLDTDLDGTTQIVHRAAIQTAERNSAKQSHRTGEIRFTRIIEACVFEGDIGPVTTRELLTMPQTEWGMLRDRITDHRHGRPAGLICRCAMCGDQVFIRARKKNGVPYPLFSHFQGGGLSCAWRHGSNEHPEQLRAQQYKGRQESQTHRLLCEQIEALGKLDERYVSSNVNTYRPPTESEHGRFPDVSIIWSDFPECVFEVQLSQTFQTEISARCTHYEREGVALVWVLFGFDPQNTNLPQSFMDVIRRHRGNAFIIDRESVAASYLQRSLVFKCYLENDSGGFDTPRLVRLDQLKFPNDSLPYLDDRVSKMLLNRIANTRRPCFDYLRTIEGRRFGDGDDSPEKQQLLSTLRAITPVLSYGESRKKFEENSVLRLIAIVFSELLPV
jgi:hypothetical protein